MNQSEVLKLSNEELKEQLVEQKMKYNELKMSHAVSPLENPIQIRSLRRSIARIAATRYMKREGSIWIKIFPDKPITKKPLEVRMGKGKGAVEYWAAVVKPGRILFEVGGVPIDVAKEALRLAAQKLPVKTKFIIARDYEEE